MELFIGLALLILIGAIVDSHRAMDAPRVIYVPVEAREVRRSGCGPMLVLGLIAAGLAGLLLLGLAR